MYPLSETTVGQTSFNFRAAFPAGSNSIIQFSSLFFFFIKNEMNRTNSIDKRLFIQIERVEYIFEAK